MRFGTSPVTRLGSVWSCVNRGWTYNDSNRVQTSIARRRLRRALAHQITHVRIACTYDSIATTRSPNVYHSHAAI